MPAPEFNPSVFFQAVLKAVINDARDRYEDYKRGELSEGRRPIGEGDYWKTHLPLTRNETMDTWVQKQVRTIIDDEIRDGKKIAISASSFAKGVFNSIFG
jgi:hypothetical protein